METLKFTYKGTKTIPHRAHVGVVGSGDLEVLIEPAAGSEVIIRTRFDGYSKIWEEIMDRFFAVHDIMAKIEINDFGATPGMVSMRLLQAVEVSYDEQNQ
jgi:malonate decarboxylase delta subunit